MLAWLVVVATFAATFLAFFAFVNGSWALTIKVDCLLSSKAEKAWVNVDSLRRRLRFWSFLFTGSNSVSSRPYHDEGLISSETCIDLEMRTRASARVRKEGLT